MTHGKKSRKLSRNQRLFFEASDPSLARRVSVESPKAFRQSIAVLKLGGLRPVEKRALVLAQNRARAQLNRKNLSSKERREFGTIVRIKLPKVTRRKRR